MARVRRRVWSVVFALRLVALLALGVSPTPTYSSARESTHPRLTVESYLDLETQSTREFERKPNQ